MSTLKVNDIQEATSGGGKAFVSRAWVHYNGTGTVAISNDGNVSSITDQGTGKYRVNFSNTITDANYSTSGGAAKDDATDDGNMVVGLNGTSNANFNATSNAHVRTIQPHYPYLRDSRAVTFQVIR